MSDIGNYYGAYEHAKYCEEQGDYLMAAVEYWSCVQIAQHGEFVYAPDWSLESEAVEKYPKLFRHIPRVPLSKTTIIKGCQCDKALWLYKNKYSERTISPELQKRFDCGHIIGELAQSLFPSGIDASKSHPALNDMRTLQTKTPLTIPKIPFHVKQHLWARETKNFIQNNLANIYEAAFIHDGVFVAADILHSTEKGYIVYEVKSSYDIRDVYLHDSALQYYIMSQSIQINDFCLVYLNEEYVSSLNFDISKCNKDNCDISKLFTIRSIFNEIISMQDIIPNEIKKCKDILALDCEPKCKIDEHCDSPYKCEFLEYCIKNSKQK